MIVFSGNVDTHQSVWGSSNPKRSVKVHTIGLYGKAKICSMARGCGFHSLWLELDTSNMFESGVLESRDGKAALHRVAADRAWEPQFKGSFPSVAFW